MEADSHEAVGFFQGVHSLQDMTQGCAHVWGSKAQFRVITSAGVWAPHTCALPAAELSLSRDTKSRNSDWKAVALSCSSQAPRCRQPRPCPWQCVLCSDSAALSRGGGSSRVPRKLPASRVGPSAMGHPSLQPRHPLAVAFLWFMNLCEGIS